MQQSQSKNTIYTLYNGIMKTFIEVEIKFSLHWKNVFSIARNYAFAVNYYENQNPFYTSKKGPHNFNSVLCMALKTFSQYY